jgi:urea transport system permease protein
MMGTPAAIARRSAWTMRFWAGFALCAVAVVSAVPILNRLVPQDWVVYLPDYLVPLLGKYLCFAILALSLDLIWGYAGILCLGQGAFFALGGYCMGMYLMRQIGTRGVYGNPDLPDFMVFLNWKSLPWYWWGFDHFAFAAAMVILVPGLLALVFGWLAFRSRITGVYLSIITQAMTFALMLAFFRNEMGFGGNNGLTDYKEVLGFGTREPDTRLGLYVASAAALALAYLACRAVTTSKLGRVLLALRDAESRVRFLGYSVTNAKLFAFTLAAVLAGIAGALYVPQVGIINPSEFSPGNSIEIAIWVSVGGRATLAGPIVGAVLVNLAKTWLTGAAPEMWLFVLGLLFVCATLVFPRGIVGLVQQLVPRRAAAASPASEAPAAELPREDAVGERV